MKTEDALLLGFGALAGFFLLSNMQRGAGDYDPRFVRKIEFARHGGDFIPAVPSLPEFKVEVPVSIPQHVQKFPSEAQGIPYVLLETPKKVVEQAGESVSKIIEEPTKKVKEITEKTTENIRVASENMKKASESALSKIKDIAMIGAGAYVGGKALGFATKMIPERKIEQKILTKVGEKIAERTARRGIISGVTRIAPKLAKAGAALTIISAGATAGKIIGEATKETDIAKSVGSWLTQKRHEKSIVGAAVDAFLKIGEFANNFLSFI